MLLNVYTIPDNFIFSKNIALTIPSKKLMKNDLNKNWFKQLIFNMYETLYTTSEAVGLAACQVGVLYQLAVMDISRDGRNPQVLINATYKPLSNKTIKTVEICASFPNFEGIVQRYQKILVRTLTLKGNYTEFVVEGNAAIPYQHEIDHLYGILYTDLAKTKRDVKYTGGYYRTLACKSIKNLGIEGDFCK